MAKPVTACLKTQAQLACGKPGEIRYTPQNTRHNWPACLPKCTIERKANVEVVRKSYIHHFSWPNTDFVTLKHPRGRHWNSCPKPTSAYAKQPATLASGKATRILKASKWEICKDCAAEDSRNQMPIACYRRCSDPATTAPDSLEMNSITKPCHDSNITQCSRRCYMRYHARPILPTHLPVPLAGSNSKIDAIKRGTGGSGVSLEVVSRRGRESTPSTPWRKSRHPWTHAPTKVRDGSSPDFCSNRVWIMSDHLPVATSHAASTPAATNLIRRNFS